ncbi:MAG TPA: SUMF1/EgtB/PvdO family nonheme iron enzyme [Pyrinomonadaceae bacterium]|nr:SUMF1/EgtB/PvdO family nonheme iron enzyme [Pyrinomonadaceae bacterium]
MNVTALVLLATLAAGVPTARTQQRRRPATASPAAPSTTTTANSKRLALVIGNNAYETAPLKNPVNDARALAQSLRERGFDVTARENLTQNEMKQAVRAFGEKLRDAGREAVGLFYYAGHGVQVQDRNYLIPVSAKVASEEEVEYEAIDVGFVMAQMDAARNSLNILILDACRDNPFARSFRSASRGLAMMSAPTGILIAYATAPGRTAGDGAGANGLYTEELLAAMRTPGLPIEDVFKQVRVKVRERSKGQQVPWESSSLVGAFYFTPPNASAASADTPERGRQMTASETALELSFWETIKDSNDPEDFKAYLEKYPNGHFVSLARRRVATVIASATPTPVPTPARDDAAGRGDAKPRDTTGSLPASITNRAGIALVLVPAGSFMMGATNGAADEQPVHRVTIGKPFYMGKYEVTQAQWTALMGNNPSDFKGAELPVEHVSWDDAQEFIRKLNALGDGYEYRLPTEAEWEYACRAGTTGDHAGDVDAMAWYNRNTKSTQPVGRKQPNKFGLYDMHGNVWEWCEDRTPEHYPYRGAPTDGSAWIDLSSRKRIKRGGSWDHDANHTRSAYRDWYTPSRHTHGIGFRVAATPRT